MHALEVKNLTKRFGKLEAVKKVSFEIPEGSVFGLIGRNGAGKTTTIRMMMNIYKPDEGEVILRGTKIGQEFRDQVGYLPEERGLYKKMKIMDTLLFIAELKGKTGPEVKTRAMEYLERFNLTDRLKSNVEDLSKGNQQKIQFISTILHDPEFIILDEPFSGLDPINTNILKDIILDLKEKGKVIIFSTHLMDFAEKMCDHIAIINKGELIVNGPLKELKEKYSKNNIILISDGDISFLKDNDHVNHVEDFGNYSSINIKDPKYAQNILTELINNKVQVKKFDANDISLHEIFVTLTGDDTEGGTNV